MCGRVRAQVAGGRRPPFVQAGQRQGTDRRAACGAEACTSTRRRAATACTAAISGLRLSRRDTEGRRRGRRRRRRRRSSRRRFRRGRDSVRPTARSPQRPGEQRTCCPQMQEPSMLRPSASATSRRARRATRAAYPFLPLRPFSMRRARARGRRQRGDVLHVRRGNGAPCRSRPPFRPTERRPRGMHGSRCRPDAWRASIRPGGANGCGVSASHISSQPRARGVRDKRMLQGSAGNA